MKKIKDYINDESIRKKEYLQSLNDPNIENSLKLTRGYIDGERRKDRKFASHLYIETSSACNYACPSCLHGNTEYSKILGQAGVMNTNELENLIIEAANNGCTSVSLFSTNEPLLDKDIFEKIEIAGRYMNQVIIVTNGSMLDKQKAERLIRSKVTMVSFSLDAISEKAYSKVRPHRGKINIEIKEVYDNIEYFLQLQKIHRKDLKTRVGFVVQKQNREDREAFRQYWKNRVDIVSFQSIFVMNEEQEQLIDENFEKQQWDCNAPMHTMLVRANGDIAPCCNFYGYEKIFSNRENMSLKEAWDSEYMKVLRKEIRDGTENEICKKCLNTCYKAKDEDS